MKECNFILTSSLDSFQVYGGSKSDYGKTIQTTPDGNFIIASQTESFGAGDYDAYLIKINPHGEVLWSKTYGGSQEDVFEDVLITPEGEYLAFGRSLSYGSSRGKSNAYIKAKIKDYTTNQ